MSLKLGQVTAVVVSSPETIQQVLQTHDHVLSYRAVPDALTPYDHGQQGFPWIPISPTCENIRRIRNTYLLSPKTLDTNRNLCRMRIDDLLDNVRRRAVNGGAVDIGGVVFATTLNLTFFPVLKKMDIQGVRRRITVHFRKMFDLIDEMIDQRLKMQESPDFTPKNDMLHHLLNMREENNEIPLHRNQIKH